MKVFGKWSERASIFSNLWVYENIHEGSSFTINSLVEPCFIEIRSYYLKLGKKNCYKSDFRVFPEQILIRGVFKPSQTSKINVIAEIVGVFKYFNCFL